MLMLKRKPGQSVHLGDDIIVYVQAIDGNQVRLGFAAPDTAKIFRTELLSPPASDDPPPKIAA